MRNNWMRSDFSTFWPQNYADFQGVVRAERKLGMKCTALQYCKKGNWGIPKGKDFLLLTCHQPLGNHLSQCEIIPFLITPKDRNRTMTLCVNSWIFEHIVNRSYSIFQRKFIPDDWKQGQWWRRRPFPSTSTLRNDAGGIEYSRREWVATSRRFILHHKLSCRWIRGSCGDAEKVK